MAATRNPASQTAYRGRAGAPQERKRFVSFVLAALILYLGAYKLTKIIGHTEGMSQTHFAHLADAFVHGRLDIDVAAVHGLTELIPAQGKYYVVYPPMPAVLLAPFVAVFGPTFPCWAFSIGIAALCIGLTDRLLRRIGFPARVSAWVTVLFGFGTTFWYTALRGASWDLAHVVAVFFLLLALLEAYGSFRPWLVGLYLGAATLSRLPIVLAAPFFLWLVSRKRGATAGRMAALLCGLGLFLGLDLLYNGLRFGTMWNAGYDLIPGVLDEPWYRQGILSFGYLPRNVHALLFQPPVLIHDFPYIVPTTFGLSLFLTTPAFLLMFLAPINRLTLAIIGAAGLVSIPTLLHGWTGGTQFGYRFSLDYTPFLLLLVAQGMRGRVSHRVQALVVLSCVVSVWGLVFAQWIQPAWLFPVANG